MIFERKGQEERLLLKCCLNKQGHKLLCKHRSFFPMGLRSEQAALVGDVPAHCRGVGLEVLWRSIPTQTIL